MATIRIAVIDDHPVFREGVISILRSDSEFELVGEGACADDAIRMATDVQPNIMLLDISMPGGGMNALRLINSSSRPVKVVILTASEIGADVFSAFELGAVGYLLKGIHKSELISNIKAAHKGETIIDPSLAMRIIGRLSRVEASGSTPANTLDQLTPREAEVLDCVSQGMTNKEIALKLALTPRTVKNYMTSVMAKLQVRNRVEAALSVLRAPA